MLPQDFPRFRLGNPNATLVLITESELSVDEKRTVEEVCHSLSESTPLQFEVAPLAEAKPLLRKSEHTGDLALTPGRVLDRSAFGRDLRFLVEEDDAFWGAQRAHIFSNALTDASVVLPADWRSPTTLRCVVNAVGAPDNVRSYLSLYSQVLLVLPLAGHFEEFCNGLGVTSQELAALVAKQRVRILLPFSIERHPVQWLNSVAEQAPSGLLLSRRLAAATVLDARRRLPLLYPPLSMHERHAVLHAISTNADQLAPAAHRATLRRFVAELGAIWSAAEQFVHFRGALGTSHIGVGFIGAFLAQELTGKDLSIALWAAAQKVEWAASLGAHAFASVSNGYDESRACDLLAALYSPQPQSDLVPSRTALKIVDNILAINSNAPVVAFADEINDTSITRLRELVLKLSREKIDPETLEVAIANFNSDVRSYEKRADRLKSFNLTGIISTATALAVADPSTVRLLPMAALFLGPLLNFAIDELPRRSKSLGKFVDAVNSLLAGQANPDAVLVSRIKKDIGRVK